MEIVWIIYLIDVVTDIRIFWGLFILLFFVTYVALAFVGPDKEAPWEAFARSSATMRPYIKWFVTAVLLSMLLNSLSPSKDTAYKMLAAYGVTELVKSEEAQKLGGKSLEVLEKAMDEYLNTEKSGDT